MAKFKRAQEKEKSDLIPVGAVWAAKSEGNFTGKFTKDSEAFLEALESVGTEGLRILFFTNNFKKNENEPDYRIYVSIAEAGGGKKSFAKKPIKIEESEDEDEETTPSPKKKAAPVKQPWDEDEED